MNWARVEGNWKQIRGGVKERWGKLTDDDLTAIAGRRDRLEGVIQERYGYAKDRAERDIEDWYRSLESNLAEEIELLRSRIQSLASTVERIAEEELPHARARATDAIKQAEDAVKNPFVVVAMALGLGLFIVNLMRR